MRKKKISSMSREAEIESAKAFGKHLSREKRSILLAVTLLACALPALLGIRLWSAIPPLFSTGLIGMNGQDDSLPRWVIVLGMPALMCILDALCHGQLWIHQDRMKLPPAQFRLVGRWGFPVISVLFCSGLIRQAAGISPLSLSFTSLCIVGLIFLMLGSHMWECPRTAFLTLHFILTDQDDCSWNRVHRVAGGTWMLIGLLILLSVMVLDEPAVCITVFAVVGLLFPILYTFIQNRSRSLS